MSSSFRWPFKGICAAVWKKPDTRFHVRSLHQFPMTYANSNGSCETAQMRRLAWAFADCQCENTLFKWSPLIFSLLPFQILSLARPVSFVSFLSQWQSSHCFLSLTRTAHRTLRKLPYENELRVWETRPRPNSLPLSGSPLSAGFLSSQRSWASLTMCLQLELSRSYSLSPLIIWNQIHSNNKTDTVGIWW